MCAKKSFSMYKVTGVIYFINEILFNYSFDASYINRYYRNTNAKPIWPVSKGRPSRADIPKCSYCGGPMCCEFQVIILVI